MRVIVASRAATRSFRIADIVPSAVRNVPLTAYGPTSSSPATVWPIPPAAPSSQTASDAGPREIRATIALEYVKDADEPVSAGAGRAPVDRAADTVSSSATVGSFS